MTKRKKVYVRAHRRRWPKRWDERLFIVVDNKERASIVVGRSAFDVEKRIGGVVYAFNSINMKHVTNGNDVQLKEL